MNQKTILAVAASTLVLAACGGGGGGGGDSLPASNPPVATDVQTTAAVRDTLAIIAGADLLARYEDGVSTTVQFGGRPTGSSSRAAGTSPISCGVYDIDGTNASYGATLATAPGAGQAAYCNVVHATAGNVQYRHYFKIVRSTTTTYDVTAYADNINTVTTLHQFLPATAHASTLAFTYVGASITGYTLDGALPATYDSTGLFVNQSGRSVIALNGSRWNAGATGAQTLGLGGTVGLRSSTDVQSALRTFGANSKATVTIDATGLNDIALTLY